MEKKTNLLICHMIGKKTCVIAHIHTIAELLSCKPWAVTVICFSWLWPEHFNITLGCVLHYHTKLSQIWSFSLMWGRVDLFRAAWTHKCYLFKIGFNSLSYVVLNLISIWFVDTRYEWVCVPWVLSSSASTVLCWFVLPVKISGLHVRFTVLSLRVWVGLKTTAKLSLFSAIGGIYSCYSNILCYGTKR